MSDIVVSGRNWLTQIPPISGVRPTINSTPDEDPDFPLANILHPSREKFWKVSSAAPSSVNVDLDLGGNTAVRLFGVLRNRVHTGSGITSVEVFTGTGSTYPPTWTSRGTMSFSGTDNNKALDISSVIVRQVRFAIAASGRFSCRFWVGRSVSSEYVAIGNEGASVTESIIRARTQARATYLGDLTYLEMATAVRRRFGFTHEMVATTAKSVWQGALNKTLLMQYSDGIWYECVHTAPAFTTARMPGSTALDTHGVVLETLP